MILAILMVVAAGLYRLMPHASNVAPVAAMALLGGMYFGRRYALWVPLAVLAVTDLVLNVHMGYPALYWPRLIDYGAFLLIGGFGLAVRNGQIESKIGAAVATPFLFYFISNFGVWLFGLGLNNQPYARTFAGLGECYLAGLPFLRGTMIGDWAFMGAFAVALVLARRAPSPRLHSLAAEPSV